jgi:hypothetical protein
LNCYYEVIEIVHAFIVQSSNFIKPKNTEKRRTLSVEYTCCHPVSYLGVNLSRGKILTAFFSLSLQEGRGRVG